MEQTTEFNKGEQEPFIPPETSTEPIEPKPWGFWTTIGFSAIIGAAYLLAAAAVMLAFFVAAGLRDPNFDEVAYGKTLPYNGLYISLSIIAYTPVVVGLVFLFAYLRKKMPLQEYLNLYKPKVSDVFLWSSIVILLGVCYDTITDLSGTSIVPEYMIQAYKTAHFLPLLWFAVVIAAPMSEEFFFRGFLLKGLEYSKIGVVWGIVITSFLWAILHTQYNIFQVVSIFIGGLFLGWARITTRSIYVPVIMHLIINLVATIECALAVSRM